MKKHAVLWTVIVGGLIYLDKDNHPQLQPNERTVNSSVVGELSTDFQTQQKQQGVTVSIPSTKEDTSSRINASQLWQQDMPSQRPQYLPENVDIEFVKANNSLRRKFDEGEKIALLIPQEDKVYEGKVISSTNAFSGAVKMTEGTLENGNPLASFSITSDSNTTLATVATGESIYQIEIDNQTGVGFVMDDRELDSLKHPEDGILPPPEGVS